MEWLTEDEFLQITAAGERKVLCEVLDRVYNKSIERALCLIPDVVNKLSAKVKNVNIILDKFMKENVEYVENKDVVLKTLQETEFEYPGLTFEDVLAKAKPTIDKRIRLVKAGEVR